MSKKNKDSQKLLNFLKFNEKLLKENNVSLKIETTPQRGKGRLDTTHFKLNFSVDGEAEDVLISGYPFEVKDKIQEIFKNLREFPSFEEEKEIFLKENAGYYYTPWLQNKEKSFFIWRIIKNYSVGTIYLDIPFEYFPIKSTEDLIELRNKKRKEKFREDFFKNKLKNVKIITGDTGSGKTYYAIKNTTGRFAYLSPTGSLVFDSFKKYAKEGDSLNALGIEILGNGGNHFTTFNNNFEINDFKTIIIDENHWAFEFQNHGVCVREIIENFNGEIIFVTGTVNFKILPEWEFVELKNPQNNFKKERIEMSEAIARMEAGVPTVVIGQAFYDCQNFYEKFHEDYDTYECRMAQGFCHSEDPEFKQDYPCKYCKKFKDQWDTIPLRNIKFSYINAKNNALEQLKAVQAFNKGEITCLIGTNILSQGINLVCENLILLDDREWQAHDGCLNTQRLGRLGRMGMTAKDAKLTWASDFEPNFEINQNLDFFDLKTEYDNNDYQPPYMTEDEKSEFIKIIFEKEVKIEKNIPKLGDIFNFKNLKVA